MIKKNKQTRCVLIPTAMQSTWKTKRGHLAESVERIYRDDRRREELDAGSTVDITEGMVAVLDGIAK